MEVNPTVRPIVYRGDTAEVAKLPARTVELVRTFAERALQQPGTALVLPAPKWCELRALEPVGDEAK